MTSFDENKDRTCVCELSTNEGILFKSFENSSFSIFGTLTKDKKVLLKYSGKLTSDDIIEKSKTPNIYLYYCFDNKWEDRNIVNMSICNNKTTYCSSISIPECEYLNVVFTTDDNKWDTDETSAYNLKVYSDMEKAIIQRYGLDATPPILSESNTIANTILKHSFFDVFKSFFSSFSTLFHFTLPK
ncbi:MAG: hypothetical protein PHD20_01285 [Clostridia bacterium]|nr:hypothetical protein [Clostridia bacterium]